MNEEYKKELDALIINDLTEIAVFFQQTFGVPLSIFKEMIKVFDNPMKQLIFCAGFREKHPKAMSVKEDPYKALSLKYFGEMPATTREEVAEKWSEMC